jgi:hypothetical protein
MKITIMINLGVMWLDNISRCHVCDTLLANEDVAKALCLRNYYDDRKPNRVIYCPKCGQGLGKASIPDLVHSLFEARWMGTQSAPQPQPIQEAWIRLPNYRSHPMVAEPGWCARYRVHHLAETLGGDDLKISRGYGGTSVCGPGDDHIIHKLPPDATDEMLWEALSSASGKGI